MRVMLLTGWLLVVLIGACGCGALDVTNDSKFWGGYRPGQQLQTRVDLLVYRKLPIPLQLDLYIGTGTGYPGGEPTVPQYVESPGKWPHVDGVLPAGTKLRISRFSFDRWESGRTTVYAVPLSGNYDRHELNIILLTDYYSKKPSEVGYPPYPDPKYFEPFE